MFQHHIYSNNRDILQDFNEVNDVYKEFFTSNEPARAAYQVAALPRGALIEIEAVAVIGNIQDD